MQLTVKEYYWKLNQRSKFLFEGSHDVHTPQKLVDEMLSQIDLVDKTILVLYNVEFLVSLYYGLKLNGKNITFLADHPNKIRIANKMGINYIENLDTTMKFDVIVGNPPYLKGKWMTFLIKAVEMSTRHVILVAPDATNNFSTRSDSFSDFLLKNGIQSKVQCTSHFPTINTGKIVIYNLDTTLGPNLDSLVDSSIDGAM